MIESLQFKGVWTIESENIVTGVKKVWKAENLIVQGFYDFIHKYLNYDQEGVPPGADDMNITHVGIGEGTTPPVRANTVMEDELERKAVTVKGYTDSQYELKVFLEAGDGNFPGGFITEVGIFTKGTATLGSGTLISRVITNIQKNANIRLTLIWTMRGL